jgi:peptidyl-prolyl cis-trans isomerase SurA
MKHQVIALMVLMAAAFSGASAQLTVSPRKVFETEAPKMQPTGKPVARINGAVLTDRDLLREMYAIFPYARQHNGTFPQAMEADIRRGALKMIEFEELVYQEALRRRMTISPARLNLAERDFIHQFHTADQYRTFLTAECQGQRRVLRAKIRRSLLIEDLLKREVGDKSDVLPAEMSAYYRQHPDKFRIGESFAIQTISVMPAKTSPEQLKEARKRADDALRQARATTSYEEFGLLAEKISEDDYRVVMGDHRLLDRSKLPPQILSVVEKMQPGQVSDLIQVDQVYAIVRLNSHLPAGMRKFADVKVSLRQYLQRQNLERLRSGLNSRLRKNAKVEEL